MDAQAEGASQAGIRTINVNGQRLRIAIRAGKGTSTPLLLMNGIGVKLELLHPFVDALDPAIEIINGDASALYGAVLHGGDYPGPLWWGLTVES